MARIRRYHRPDTLEVALQLLDRPDVRSAPLGGGTVVNAGLGDVPDEVIDLQDLGLSEITRDGDMLEVGATATLRDLMEHEWTPPILRDLARREAPNTIRNAATLGGTVAAALPDSGLVAGLLVCEAIVIMVDPDGTREVPLDEALIGGLHGGLVTSIRFSIGGEGVFEGTARTPADVPIVLVAGRRGPDGSLRLAATGVDRTPVMLDAERLDGLTPPSDFRGSSEYRLHLVTTLAHRVMARLGGEGRS